MPKIAPGVTEYGHPGTPAPAIPSVTRRQALRALSAAGLLGEVEAAIDALPEPERVAARIDWDNAMDFRRDFPLVIRLAAALELTDGQLDDLFSAAAAIQ